MTEAERIEQLARWKRDEGEPKIAAQLEALAAWVRANEEPKPGRAERRAS